MELAKALALMSQVKGREFIKKHDYDLVKCAVNIHTVVQNRQNSSVDDKKTREYVDK